MAAAAQQSQADRMDLEKLARYAAQRFEGIRCRYPAACGDFDEEAIHEMRVEVKRLKALCRLLAALRPGFDAKQATRPISPVYKSAGALRDLQVQAGLARSWAEACGACLGAYSRHIQVQEEKARQGLLEAGGAFDVELFDEMERPIAELLESLTACQTHRSAEAFLEGLLAELLQRGQASRAGDNFHPLRILSKRARHTAELLTLCLSESRPSAEQLETLTAMEQALGQWHDCDVGLRFLESYQQQSGRCRACGEYGAHLREKQQTLSETFRRVIPRLGASRKDAKA